VFSDDLLVASPCLAFMLAKAASMTGRKGLVPPVWATRPYDSQKGLLGKLAFPPTGQMRQIARKIVHSAVSVPRLRALRAAIRDVPEILDRLSHVPRINANVLAAASGGRLQVTPRLYAQLSDPSRDDRSAPLGNRIADTMRGWRLLHPRGPFRVLDRVEQIEARHEQIVEELKHYEMRAVRDFPPPPVPGTPSIVPLLNVADLVIEGREQHNCVASYARLARRRQVALYKVLAPQRATLSLVREDGVWRIDELETACNRGVSASTRAAVNHWLDEASR
jgi:PcfJ-like protein